MLISFCSKNMPPLFAKAGRLVCGLLPLVALTGIPSASMSWIASLEEIHLDASLAGTP